uniref:CCHC-type domain-containing protein n=1 Tax=Tanacetum cinerariifolium TaxID=118510 RepID=A0A6L2JCD7_TANCI|nr:hypothetical protein [Tanacetum cinerariifolium]
MSTPKTYQQSLADADSETRPLMLERGSYIPWASRFRRYMNRKRENRKWLNKSLDEGPYQFQMFIPSDLIVPRLQTLEDLQGDASFHYDTEIEVMNLILLSIPNDIYNSVDACTSARDMWKRVKRLMRGTIQYKVDRETHFTNEFDQFVAEPREALVSVYNHFAQLMNDLERNDMYFLIQFEKLVNASRAKKLEKSHDPLALVAHTGSSSRNTSSYYVTHPTSVVDCDDEYQQDDIQTDPLTSAMLLLARAITQNFSNPTNNRLHTSSNTKNQAIIQGGMVNIQSRNSGNTERNNRRAYVQEEVVEGSNASNETENVQRSLRTSFLGNTLIVQCYNCSGKGHYARNCPKPRNDFLFADAPRMEEIKELSENICLMARIQPANNTSDVGPSYDSAFIKIPLNIRDTEDTLDDASKSQQKMNGKMNDPIAIANKQNCWKINYKQINALYKDSVPQKELSAEQKYFSSSFIPSDKTSNATPTIPSLMSNFQVQSLIKERDNVKLEYQKLFDSIKKTRSQTQKEMDELIAHVFEKTYAYGAIHAKNQNLLFTISELKTRLENVTEGVVILVKGQAFPTIVKVLPVGLQAVIR